MARSQPLYEGDSDPGTEPDTPKPQRTKIRKRMSEAHFQDQDASFASDSGARAQRSVDINDDAAEKRRRRKSTRITVIDHPGPEEGQEQAESSRAVRQKQQLTTVTPPTVINVDENVLNNYENWMKVATDNKITAANAWTFALIDYFHDMSLLRNNDDNSINFQRASCTLDGCVKIWTSRVDSVGTETAKLASNLASGGIGSDDEDDDAGSDNQDEDHVRERKKKSTRSVATLAKDPSQLRAKKLDLEFSVDPLFRKTCADFDEGGAQGLLMNHLSLGVGQDGSLRVVFDASDSISKMEEEEDVEEPEDLIDLTELRNTFLPNLDDLESKAISHSLEDFSFSQSASSLDETTFFQDNTNDDDDDGGDFGAGYDMTGGDAQDFFAGDDAVNSDFTGGDMMGAGDYGDVPQGDFNQAGEGAGGYVAFDPRSLPQKKDLVLAMTDDQDGGMMDYFDKTFLKNWAGPEHWKLRRPLTKTNVDSNAPKEPKRREKKEAFKIDFLSPSTTDPNQIIKELFAPPGKGQSINLPGTATTGKKSKRKVKEKRSNHTLPDDMHFSSEQLVSLFLKPKFKLQMRNSKGFGRGHGEGGVDEDFWAQAAEQAAERDRDPDETANGGPIPFNTQFFNDDYDDIGPGFDDIYDGTGPVDPEDQDLLASTQGQSRRVRPETIKYSKRSKRVDVRKLKDNIWKELDIVVPPKQPEEDAMDIDDRAKGTDPSEGRQFDSVISNLHKAYPRDKMEDISTSYCFICLLHLANEQGLKLEGGSLTDSSSKATQVGDLWDLKVYRDPEASEVV
ncbi:hypothetical protein VNI00_002767 [Paramarasmius palmivorus]|uniref:Condensin complex subunit 2 n=1 Tax=Paramarasmius palmivorus TaxID=297713 RepID=A0AAW0DXQ6_9AGAR